MEIDAIASIRSGDSILARIFSFTDDVDVFGYVNGNPAQRYWDKLELRGRRIELNYPTTLGHAISAWGSNGGDAEGFWNHQLRYGDFDTAQRQQLNDEFARVARLLATQPVGGILEPVTLSPFLPLGRNFIHVEVTPRDTSSPWSAIYQLLLRTGDGKETVLSTLLFNAAQPAHDPVSIKIVE